jgi:hypothetical protein
MGRRRKNENADKKGAKLESRVNHLIHDIARLRDIIILFHLGKAKES